MKIEQRVQEAFPRPGKLSATQVGSNGVFETQTLDVARYESLRHTLTLMRAPDPEVVAYWVTRTGAREDDFAARALALIKTIPPLATHADELQRASDAMAGESLKAERIRSGYFSLDKEENDALKRTLDLKGKRRDLAMAVRAILRAAGTLDSDRNETWKPLYLFLQTDMNAAWTGARARLDGHHKAELRKIFFEATSIPGLADHFEKLEQIYNHLEVGLVDLLANALKPGQTPMQCLSDARTRDYAATLLAFDREVVRACDSSAAKADPAAIRVLVALYPVWESLDRYHAYLQARRRTYALNALEGVARTVLMAESWQPQDFDPETGDAVDEFIVQRAGHLIDLLEASRHDPAPAPLYAALAIDPQGKRASTPYAWVTWQWLTEDDLDDMRLDGRVLQSDGVQWLLPAGSRVKSISSRAEAFVAKAQELILAVDTVHLGTADGAHTP